MRVPTSSGARRSLARVGKALASSLLVATGLTLAGNPAWAQSGSTVTPPAPTVSHQDQHVSASGQEGQAVAFQAPRYGVDWSFQVEGAAGGEGAHTYGYLGATTVKPGGSGGNGEVITGVVSNPSAIAGDEIVLSAGGQGANATPTSSGNCNYATGHISFPGSGGMAGWVCGLAAFSSFTRLDGARAGT